YWGHTFMLSRFNHHNVTWIDLESPTKEEVISVVNEFHIHPSIGEELLNPSLRPKAELRGNAIYMIMHFPARTDNPETIIEKEIDFAVGKNFIITAHYESFDPIYEFQKMFKVSAILARHGIGEHAG